MGPTRSRISSAANREPCNARRKYFPKLFHEQSNNEDFAVIVRSVDWGRVRWELQVIPGMTLRHVRVAREYQRALDEARDEGARIGTVDKRQEVVDHTRDAKSWIVPPVAVTCDLLPAG